MIDHTQRFSGRVENYIRYRPRYPQAVIKSLQKDCQLTPESLVADIGSGTGLLSDLFLRNGNQVFGIEPNSEMRAAGERLLGLDPRFQSINGRAEATTLGNHCVDFVAAGQAFHWFDRDRARKEFRRILKPAGWVMLVWNERQTEGTPFLLAYEQLLRKYGTNYAQVTHREVGDEVLADWFGTDGFTRKTFHQEQIFNYASVKGRLLSSSYAPQKGHPRHQPMLGKLAEIFQAHQIDGTIDFPYRTQMYYGRLS